MEINFFDFFFLKFLELKLCSSLFLFYFEK